MSQKTEFWVKVAIVTTGIVAKPEVAKQLKIDMPSLSAQPAASPHWWSGWFKKGS